MKRKFQALVAVLVGVGREKVSISQDGSVARRRQVSEQAVLQTQKLGLVFRT
jgi:hypothetical protein